MLKGKSSERAHARVLACLLIGMAPSACAEADEEKSETPAVAAQKASPPSPAFEAPPVLQAADVLPAGLQKGPDFHVAPQVHSDGFMNRYLLKTSWGDVQVVSTPLLHKRVRETAAIRQLENMSKTEEFAQAVGGAGQGAVRGAVALVKNPVASVSGAVSGVGKVFGMAKKGITSSEGSEAEDDRWKQVVGYSQTKRDLAKQLRVDVYSRNPQLQKALDEMAWAGWSGGVTGGLALVAIPGAAGMAVSLSKNTDMFQRIDVSKPPGELREINRRRLAGIGIPSASIDRFIGDSTLSPTQQSLVAVNLQDLKGTEGRGAFLDFAAQAPDPDLAGFVVLQAAMYARYHQDEQPIARFEGVGPRLVARTDDGSTVVIHPMDRLFWTESLAGIVGSVDSRLGDAPHKLLWVGGTASERAREGIEAAGWELREGALAELLDD